MTDPKPRYYDIFACPRCKSFGVTWEWETRPKFLCGKKELICPNPDGRVMPTEEKCSEFELSRKR